MADKKFIRLTEQGLRNLVQNMVRKALKESMWDNYENDVVLTGKEDFEDSSFEYELNKRYPGRNFECWCDNDGTVTVTDLDTEKEYIGYGEVVYDNVPLGKPDPRNPYSEAEGSEGHYDFTEALRDIMAKIDADENENIIAR